MLKAIQKLVVVLLVLGCVGLAGAFAVFQSATSPAPAGQETVMRINGTTTRKVLLAQFEKDGVIKNARMSELWARFNRKPAEFKTGSYRIRAGMTLDELFASLNDPIKKLVRLPEGWWMARFAKKLEEEGVCTAKAYKDLVVDPSKFEAEFEWLPKKMKSLEGFLFPDTYNLPPQTPAEEVIRMQLKAFESKVLPKISDPDRLRELLIVASMVEQEAAKDSERPKVAGVIYNRLRKGQRLEIDATVLYALQRWFTLGPGVVRTVNSPFNTYLNDGLPPGPIGSPSLKSIMAAQEPDSHPYYYYVAQADRSHLFATTYAEHLNNIRKVRRQSP